MLILGIETSCDETSAAIVKDGKEILSNTVSSQIKEHTKYGGVVPEVASRLHIEKIIEIIRKACKDANVKAADVDGIAVTYGPGLVGSLLVGIEAAKSIAYSLDKPLIPVNHIHAHLFSPLLEDDSIQYPYLGLVVSGGHTSLVLVKDYCEYELIGQTVDDAVGEAFDKAAKFLGLGYPGGPVIDKLSKTVTSTKYSLPIPRLKKGGLDFSFSGLKTAVINTAKKAFPDGIIPDEEKAEIAYAFQNTAVKYLLKNTKEAVEQHNVKTIVFAGGVAANSHLRDEAQKLFKDRKTYFPSLSLCTDNAAMIAGLACYKLKNKPDYSASLDLNAVPGLTIGKTLFNELN